MKKKQEEKTQKTNDIAVEAIQTVIPDIKIHQRSVISDRFFCVDTFPSLLQAAEMHKVKAAMILQISNDVQAAEVRPDFAFDPVCWGWSPTQLHSGKLT